ncbi:HPr family phosphocarrier protein [uncultured Robinsoniella sp.]|uniref:HPr family phosphocarrier protein n=1 Tax=uncultured Robinsoniella sp. TaxID=904190 RepID=UPI00374EFE9F
MREFEYEIIDLLGLHARPASRVFMEARKYECKIEALCGNKKADCKSLLELMGLGAKHGNQILFRFDGADEDAAAEGLRQLLL